MHCINEKENTERIQNSMEDNEGNGWKIKSTGGMCL